ncbi:hypothetical protein JOH50_004853 [Rhizobium leguminosarum]|uniref:hypothetical protein n=1 Tax=Rhizobium leguminosarum TaxID=384 RepID=UPI001AEB4477|nr:hypothetical protein [Rhizobium leguminosarum]MBP2489126.1 hypothetical protein [Rhizobium leguminosarum]
MLADALFEDQSDSFSVLMESLRFGGIVPGLPDAIKMDAGPPPVAVAQRLADVDFERRWKLLETGCGIAVPSREFVALGATTKVVPGRDDVEVPGLLSWSADNCNSVPTPFWSLDQQIHLVELLSLTEFSRSVILVDFEHEAELVQDLLTAKSLGREFHDEVGPNVYERTTIIWAEDGHSGAPESAPYLLGFKEIPAISGDASHGAVADRVKAAFAKVERMLSDDPSPAANLCTCYFTFTRTSYFDTTANFLIDADLVVRMPEPDRFMLTLSTGLEREGSRMDPDRAALAASSLSLDLDLPIELVMKR